MQIHELSTKKRKAKKTIGRGGKRGTYSGKGNKGQKARSGGSMDPLFEGGRSSLVERMKKVRGFKSTHAKKAIVKLEELENKLKDGDVITFDSLLVAGLVDKTDVAKGVKILSNGAVSKKFTVEKGILLSKTAKDAIIKAGGKIII